MIFLVIIGLAI
jgi:HlyD family secretion protein